MISRIRKAKEKRKKTTFLLFARKGTTLEHYTKQIIHNGRKPVNLNPSFCTLGGTIIMAHLPIILPRYHALQRTPIYSPSFAFRKASRSNRLSEGSVITVETNKKN